MSDSLEYSVARMCSQIWKISALETEKPEDDDVMMLQLWKTLKE
jgi:hypothetical protein